MRKEVHPKAQNEKKQADPQRAQLLWTFCVALGVALSALTQFAVGHAPIVASTQPAQESTAMGLRSEAAGEAPRTSTALAGARPIGRGLASAPHFN